MKFKDTFCSSPWFHMKIASDGSFRVCRWGKSNDKFYQNNYGNIKNMPPDIWFQTEMENFRSQFTFENDYKSNICGDCHKMEQYGKVSGRQKQLLKTGIKTDKDFKKSLASSPWIGEFNKSLSGKNNDLMPQDWQIDLGNLCNSGCVMCHPVSSSFLETEFKKIGILDRKQPKSWTQDPEALENFFSCLGRSPKISYMHFIGGEPLIMPAFKQILNKLIEYGLNENITIGFTTNLTVWDEELIDILKHIPNLHIGLSVECLDSINDYVRYGSNISSVTSILNKWRDIAKQHSGWLIQIRTTPTLLTIEKLHTIYEYAWENNMSVESCNFLEEPDFLRPTVLPPELRKIAIHNLQNWIKNNDKNYFYDNQSAINVRHPDFARQYLIEDAKSYVNYLQHEEDESHLLPDLVEYLQKIEKNRGNCVLDYAPQYESLLKSVGYTRQ